MCQQNDNNNSCGVTINMYTSRGHVIGMLDRDQRTAKIPTFTKTMSGCCIKVDGLADTVDESLVFREGAFQSNIPSKTHKKITQSAKKKNCLWKSIQRLKQVLVVGTYLLSIVSIPSSLSAPTHKRTLMEARLATQPKWINPCGITQEAKDHLMESGNEERLPDEQLVTSIISQATKALRNAKLFKDEFTNATLQMDTESSRNLLENAKYDWLPNIPKKLGQNLTEDVLKTVTLENTTIDIYQDLQRVAVGLEQIVWDEEDHNGRFLNNFNQSEFELHSVLCEIQMAILEMGLQQKPDITRDIMSDEYRKMSNTEVNLRNWLIYRDYMNCLEYTVEVFEHIKKHL